MLDKASTANKANKKAYLTDEDKQIMTAAKNKKREIRRERSKENNQDDPFDQLLENYKKKVLGKIQKMDKMGGSGTTFEEVDVDSD